MLAAHVHHVYWLLGSITVLVLLQLWARAGGRGK